MSTCHVICFHSMTMCHTSPRHGFSTMFLQYDHTRGNDQNDRTVRRACALVFSVRVCVLCGCGYLRGRSSTAHAYGHLSRVCPIFVSPPAPSLQSSLSVVNRPKRPSLHLPHHPLTFLSFHPSLLHHLSVVAVRTPSFQSLPSSHIRYNHGCLHPRLGSFYPFRPTHHPDPHGALASASVGIYPTSSRAVHHGSLSVHGQWLRRCRSPLRK